MSGPLVPKDPWGLAFEERVGMCSFLLKVERWREGMAKLANESPCQGGVEILGWTGLGGQR